MRVAAIRIRAWAATLKGVLDQETARPYEQAMEREALENHAAQLEHGKAAA